MPVLPPASGNHLTASCGTSAFQSCSFGAPARTSPHPAFHSGARLFTHRYITIKYCRDSAVNYSASLQVFQDLAETCLSGVADRLERRVAPPDRPVNVRAIHDADRSGRVRRLALQAVHLGPQAAVPSELESGRVFAAAGPEQPAADSGLYSRIARPAMQSPAVYFLAMALAVPVRADQLSPGQSCRAVRCPGAGPCSGRTSWRGNCTTPHRRPRP